jgi:signal peptidase II
MPKGRLRTLNRIATAVAAVATADLLTKRSIIESLAPGERRVVIPGAFSLQYVQNVHGAMGLFGSRAAVLVILALAVLAVLAWLLRDGLRTSPLVQIGFGMVAGGAFGNIADRLVHGYVVDFLAFWSFYVFNVADACITAGVALIVLASFERRRVAA